MFMAELQRALDLNPNDPEILAEAGHYICFLGEYDRGIAYSRRAQELNPLHPGWYHFAFARLHFRQRRFEEALADVQRISMPRFFWARLLQAATLGQLDDPRAPRALSRMHETRPGKSAQEEIEKWNTSPEDTQLIMEGLRKAGYEA